MSHVSTQPLTGTRTGVHVHTEDIIPQQRSSETHSLRLLTLLFRVLTPQTFRLKRWMVSRRRRYPDALLGMGVFFPNSDWNHQQKSSLLPSALTPLSAFRNETFFSVARMKMMLTRCNSSEGRKDTKTPSPPWPQQQAKPGRLLRSIAEATRSPRQPPR